MQSLQPITIELGISHSYLTPTVSEKTVGVRATQPIPAACYHYTHGGYHIADEIKHKNTRTPARLISTGSTLLTECRTGNLVARLVGMKMNRIAIETGATLKSRPCFSAAFRPYVILRYTSYLMVGVRGFEPPTSSSRTKRASHCATPRNQPRYYTLYRQHRNVSDHRI